MKGIVYILFSVLLLSSLLVSGCQAVPTGEAVQHPRVSIAVTGPGSGVGIAALINGTTDICQASRKIKSKEINQAKANGVNPYEIQVAADALAVVVHPSNPVSGLTIAHLLLVI